MFTSHPNQRIVTVSNAPIKGQFLQIPLEDMKAACRNLTASQVIVWQILAGNANNYKFAFSPAAINKDYGLSIKTIQNAFATLIEKGYLIETSPNQYVFYRHSQNFAADNEVVAESSTKEEKKKKMMERLIYGE